MKGINLLEEGILLSDEQIEMLAFMIKPEDIKNYINEHKKEYRHWFIHEMTKEIWEEHGDVLAQKIEEGIPEFVKNLKSQKYFTKIESLMQKQKSKYEKGVC